MKKDQKEHQAAQPVEKEITASRRAFLKGTGGISAAVAVAATGLLSLNSGAKAATETSAPAPKPACPPQRVTVEPPIPTETTPPKITEYECDVLVIGGGFAGLNAAIGARAIGKEVILVDKGRPGYSGLSPFASSHRWFDPEFGDDQTAFRACIQRGGDYISNLSWYQVWIEESKQAYQRLMDWGILTQFPKASDSGDYFKKLDYVGYREKFAKFDRRAKFTSALRRNKVSFVQRTMITDVIRENGRVVGAMGFDVPSGTIMTFHAKAVVLCTGGGSYKPSGYPTGTNSFDGEYICYNLGLPIIGKEFDDFHSTVAHAPGNAFLNNSWTYLENIWLCGGDIDAKNALKYADIKAKIMVLERVKAATEGLANDDGSNFEDLSKSSAGRRGGSLSGNPLDPRQGKKNDSMQKGYVFGAAVGMCAHLSSGVFCGLDDIDGFTGIPGLYVAGDGANGSVVSGSAYPCGVGFTSSFCSIQGWRAGQTAARYTGSVGSVKISADKKASITKTIETPTTVKQGADPNWARDVLQAIMAPYWINIAKSESTLSGALAQVEFMRDEVVPQLMATSPHALRLCHEIKHKVLSAEMKLRAGLERKESRGFHYRRDFPFRDDKNFLCYIATQKAKDGGMTTSKIAIKDEWKGDTNQDYAKRYGYRFPGETEAKGLPPEPKRSGKPG